MCFRELINCQFHANNNTVRCCIGLETCINGRGALQEIWSDPLGYHNLITAPFYFLSVCLHIIKIKYAWLSIVAQTLYLEEIPEYVYSAFID